MWWTTAAWATWTVAAVDPDTREVGVAGATCGPFVWMVAELVPDRGAVAAQYATWLEGKHAIADGLAEGATPADALARVTADGVDVHPELRQYGVVGFAGESAGFSGSDVEAGLGWWGDATLSVQGNTLRDATLPEVAAEAFQAAEGLPLDERLLLALEAGRDLGGDARCDAARPAQSAFLFVAGPEDEAAAPSVQVRASSFLNGDDPVARVRDRWEGTLTGLGCSAASAGEGWIAAALAASLPRRRARRGDDGSDRSRVAKQATGSAR